MSAHTPGPWIVEPCADDYDGAINVVSEYSETAGRRTANWIAECDLQREEPHGIAENHANARLIAAAPELLALVRRYLDNHCANADAEGMSAICECRLCLDARASISWATRSKLPPAAHPAPPKG